MFRCKAVATAVALYLTTVAAPSVAEFSYAVGSEIGVMQIQVNKEDFYPVLLNVYFDARHDSGFGAELMLATGISEGDAAQVELELSEYEAVFATYSVTGRRVTTTFGLGYGNTKLDASLRGDSYPGTSSYEGGTGFIRFTEGFKTWPDWHLSMGLSALFDNSDIDIWSANIGLRYEF